MSKVNNSNSTKNKDINKSNDTKIKKDSLNENKSDDIEIEKQNDVLEENLESDIGEIHKDDKDEEINKIKDQLLRTLAENENIRKRTSKDIEQVKRFGHISFVRDLLSSVDNLSRAVDAAPSDREKLEEPIKNLIDGVEIVLNEINSFLEKNFISEIDPLGEKFNYNLHQAMYEEPSEKYDPGTITEVIQKGYLLHDRLVRPAMVGISKKIEKKDN